MVQLGFPVARSWIEDKPDLSFHISTFSVPPDD